MIAVPEVTPETIPVVDPTVATAILLLIHKPPPTVLPSVVVLRTHTLVVPVIVAGEALTVTVLNE
jgi:hypothetical protein